MKEREMDEDTVIEFIAATDEEAVRLAKEIAKLHGGDLEEFLDS
jgi:ABC-type iron transport system FetAB ATPase subunit